MLSSSKNIEITVRGFFVCVFLQQQQFATVNKVKEHGADLDLREDFIWTEPRTEKQNKHPLFDTMSNVQKENKVTDLFHSFLCGGAHTINTHFIVSAHTYCTVHIVSGV